MKKLIVVLFAVIAFAVSTIRGAEFRGETYMAVMNGREVFTIVHNTADSVTVTQQPFIIFSADKEALCDLVCSEWDENNPFEQTPREVEWHVSYDTIADAQDVCDLVNTADADILIRPVKHSDRDEWATPYIQEVFDNIPASETKTTLLNMLNESDNNGYRKTKAEMEADGWF